jgi:uncharacterized membrane protein YphA (DoxX/SURF4 family)
MARIRELNKWANANTCITIDLLRFFLGGFLFLKGVSFIVDKKYLHEILNTVGNFGSEMLLIHYVAMAHMAGGVMIIIGFLTRWSIWVQLPILFGAFMINFIGVFNSSDFIQSLLAFITSVFFIFFGSGKHSVDYYLKMQE